ncbi:MAG TPA: site-2 protease family protein [Gemmatimonadales bacterium]|nr:site-2 protease family protein [Gemmatimonadales bacterium]
MSFSFRLARIFGTDVKVHGTFLLLLAWFWYQAQQEAGVEAAGMVTLFLLLLFTCILLHEFGHILMARRYGIRTPDVILLPIGGVARLERMPEEPRQELFIALAGPLVTMAIAGGLYAWLHFTGGEPGWPWEASADPTISQALLYANTMLLLFNLVPAFPLDGGRVLRALLSMRMPHVRATHIAARIGQTAAVLGGVYALYQGEFLWALIALFIFSTAATEARAVALREAVRARRIEEVMNTSLAALAEEATIGQVLPVLTREGQGIFPVLDLDRRVIGSLTREGIIRGMADRGPATPIRDLIEREPPVLVRGQNLEMALGALEQSGRPMLPVVDEAGRLIGFFSAGEVGTVWATGT